MKKVGIIGLWHQGIVGAACMSKVGYEVIAYDRDVERISTLNKGQSTIFEPGLDELLSAGVQGKRLSFTTDLLSVINECQDIMVMFDTPVDDDDNLDLSEIYDTFTNRSEILYSDCRKERRFFGVHILHVKELEPSRIFFEDLNRVLPCFCGPEQVHFHCHKIFVKLSNIFLYNIVSICP